MNPTINDRAKYQHMELTFRTLQGECARCVSQMRPEWQFCAHCDTRLATQCPGCGVPLPPAGASHCGHCGLVFARTSD
jgi:predicted amidophosphoribosyltransferase